MTGLGNRDHQEIGRWLNNRVENSYLPFRRRERAMLKFRQMKTLQKLVSIHASIHNHFNAERHLIERQTYKDRRSAALAEWRGLCRLIARRHGSTRAHRRQVAIRLTAPPTAGCAVGRDRWLAFETALMRTFTRGLEITFNHWSASPDFPGPAARRLRSACCSICRCSQPRTAWAIICPECRWIRKCGSVWRRSCSAFQRQFTGRCRATARPTGRTPAPITKPPIRRRSTAGTRASSLVGGHDLALGLAN